MLGSTVATKINRQTCRNHEVIDFDWLFAYFFAKKKVGREYRNYILKQNSKYILFISAFLLSFQSSAQNKEGIWNAPSKVQTSVSRKTAKTVGTFKRWKNHLQQWGLDSNYHHALFLGGRLFTNGWGGEVFYQKPVGDGYDRKRGKYTGQSQFYRLGFSEVKHEKEIKQQGKNTAFPELGNTTPFIFGKVNNLYLLQIGYGREQLLLPRILEGNISLSFRYGAGFSLGLLKPYYLRLLYTDFTVSPQKVWLQEEAYSDANKDLFLNRDRVFGASKWSKGLGSIDYVPGAYLDGAFVIETANSKNFIQTVTIGGQLSVYSKSLGIMADQKAYPFMGVFYVGLALGKTMVIAL